MVLEISKRSVTPLQELPINSYGRDSQEKAGGFDGSKAPKFYIMPNPDIRAFYQRLCAKGKPRKVALIAAMRKLLILRNAILRTQTPWIEGYNFASES